MKEELINEQILYKIERLNQNPKAKLVKNAEKNQTLLQKLYRFRCFEKKGGENAETAGKEVE